VNNVAESMIAAGRVSTQARAILFSVPHPHPLLTVVRTVSEIDAPAGRQENPANPVWRLVSPAGRMKQIGIREVEHP